jgi:hypothetical protein
MALGNIAARPDLQPLFGPLSSERHDALRDRFLAIDAQLVTLAEQASAHVGVPYRAWGLDLLISDDGSSPGIHGGPSGGAGDIWFDISPAGLDRASGRPIDSQWIVASILVVFCCDSPEPKGGSNTHELIRLEESAHTPERVFDILEAHVARMAAEVAKTPRERFTMTPHDELP